MEKKNLRYSINASAISRYANRNFDLCLRQEWNCALTEGMTDEECLLINKLMKQMVQNAQTYIAKKEEEVTCNKEH